MRTKYQLVLSSGIKMLKKKIWLFGDFSGYHKAINDILCESNEYASVLVSSGDGWKGIENNGISLRRRGGPLASVLFKLYDLLRLYWSLPKDIGASQLMNPIFITESSIVNYLFFRKIRKNSRKVVLICAGTDALLWHYAKNYKYSYITNQIKAEPEKRHPWASWHRALLNRYIVKYVDSIVPTMYEYNMPYTELPNTRSYVLLPCPVDEFNKHPDIYPEDKEKIVFFHGVTRPHFKGSCFIKDAFQKASEIYGDKAEFIISEKMPYKEYLKAIERADVIVDQCLSYSYGINAILALASGKICFSGAEPIAIKNMNIINCPIINILPCSEQILNEIGIILEKDSLELNQLKLLGLEYVQKYHSPNLIQKQLSSYW